MTRFGNNPDSPWNTERDALVAEGLKAPLDQPRPEDFSVRQFTKDTDDVTDQEVQEHFGITLEELANNKEGDE